MKKLYVIRFIFCLFIGLSFKACKPMPTNHLLNAESLVFYDTTRQRKIPIELYTHYRPQVFNNQLVIINNGYGSSNTEYAYIAKKLINMGYIVASIQHEQPEDEAIPSGENMYELRKPIWERGAKSIEWVVLTLKKRYPKLKTDELILIGHSNGGDIAMWFAHNYPAVVSKVISLDHRRMPIPRLSKPQIMSIRAAEFAADKGVLPNAEEQIKYGIRIVDLKNTKHDDFRDVGKEEIKAQTKQLIADFLK
jgi:pimeloyl-ACP methyl ester carboxylesterase